MYCVTTEHSNTSRDTTSRDSNAASGHASASTTRSSETGTRSKDHAGTKSKKRKRRKDFIKINKEVHTYV